MISTLWHVIGTTLLISIFIFKQTKQRQCYGSSLFRILSLSPNNLLLQWNRKPDCFSGFISSYGSQLESMNVKRITAYKCRIIVRHCFNAFLHLNFNFLNDIFLMFHGRQNVVSTILEDRNENFRSKAKNIVFAISLRKPMYVCNRIKTIYVNIRLDTMMSTSLFTHPLKLYAMYLVSFKNLYAYF